ncbi:MAG: deoxyribonuclease IV [Eubacteriaceae bacterium]|nr:deoxyribonuclease IV [Eubacteriaceae bacterium]
MFMIGCHLSNSKGYSNMAKQSVEIGANTFQYFSRNPRGGAAKALDMKDIAKFLEFSIEAGIHKPLAHAPYTLNPCAKEPKTAEFAKYVLESDLSRLENIPGGLYTIHPGNHVGQGPEKGVGLAGALLDVAMPASQTTTLLLETMAGKGSEIGCTFGQLASIIDLVGEAKRPRIGVCFDTCHVYSAGYDIVGDLDGVLGEFGEVLGMEKLMAVHLNDSANPFGSRKDRHAKIGEGSIGLEAFGRIINHPLLRDLPFYLETPNEIDGYKEEIALLKSMRD